MNLTPNFSPDLNPTGGKLEKEMKPLAVYPIFRANDLYCAMFPEIKPLFEKGEEPSTKKVWKEILKHRGESIVLDRTCLNVIADSEKMNLEEFPEELESFGLKPKQVDDFDIGLANKVLKEKFGTSFSRYTDETLDVKIIRSIDVTSGPFSEIVHTFLDIAKEKNPNIQKVFILDGNLADHVNGELSHNDKEVSEIFKDQVKQELGLDAEIVSSLSADDVDETTLVIVDRHNRFSNNVEKMPRQMSVLPLDTELWNNMEFLQSIGLGNNFAKELRKNFETTS